MFPSDLVKSFEQIPLIFEGAATVFPKAERRVFRENLL